MVARISRLRTQAAAVFDKERAEVELARTNDAYREAKRQLKNAILRSKKASWTNHSSPSTVSGFPTEAEWQRRWDVAVTGRWTMTLIPNISRWTGRRFGEVNYHLSQFLSGHGCLGKYLYKIKKVENTNCVDCGAVMDDPEHAFFSCDRWWRQRRELEVLINRDFSPPTAVAEIMIEITRSPPGVQVYSCYASPNRPHAQYESFLRRLEASVRSIPPGTPVLVTGDFNNRSATWGDWIDNLRGDELSAMFETLEIAIANTGSTPTFNRDAGSIVDITVRDTNAPHRKLEGHG
ncbi:Uncharacterized protein FWK35_00017643 [Aphis craccivora]|uniref:Endonuclease/exonuclease/phosphatase domain-containing protein n=1 Tax=Aphis craccivora TaxID=307492 RepID=A0A6G0Y4C8_APHCR|nr:Uncharacterized protein FWK35_00017643 [Aphis craccivora]